jgi:hypothetical protein
MRYHRFQFPVYTADTDQNEIADLPIGAREHIHLRPKFDLSTSSEEVIIGRLDAKGTGVFYDRYIPAKNKIKLCFYLCPETLKTLVFHLPTPADRQSEEAHITTACKLIFESCFYFIPNEHTQPSLYSALFPFRKKNKSLWFPVISFRILLTYCLLQN